MASEKGLTEIVKYLVDAKASFNHKTKVSWPSNPDFYVVLYSGKIILFYQFIHFDFAHI